MANTNNDIWIDVETLAKLKNITRRAVRLARPIFKSAYERYEWHMQNGCICQEDRTWLANYIKSDEYKEIYS